ncbi:helix-turn-helix transcriptional regulator [Candidatus Woesearchaeota archaeon]|nr:helix-turn-helix transcriptional regulator [Candidatus Woesearchaeota archaeon]
MTKYIPPDIEARIQELWKKGWTAGQIASITNLPRHIIDYRTRLRDKARKEGFSSLYEWKKTQILKNDFPSVPAYRTYLAQEQGFPTLQKYREFLEKFKPQNHEKQQRLERARRKNFSSFTAYARAKQEERKQQPQNLALSYLMEVKMKNGDNTRLARITGKNKSTIHRYKSGYLFPSPEVLEKILETLQIPREELDQLTLEMRLHEKNGDGTKSLPF